MRKFLFNLPLIVTLTFVNFAFANSNVMEEDSYAIDEESMVSRTHSRDDHEMPGRDMNQSKDSSCCFETRCGCETYKRCCYPLPLPVVCGWFFVEGEYLYWKTYALLPYAAKGVAVPPFNINNVTPMSRDIKTVGLDADSGYRVSLGAYINDCYYGVARYTQYSADGKDSFNTFFDGNVEQLQEQVSPMWLAFPLLNTLVAATDLQVDVNAKHRFREKLLDFDFYRTFSCSRYSFNPFVGVRFGWVKTDLRVDYDITGTFITQIIGDFPFRAHVDVNHHLNLGVGLHVGTDMNVDLCWGFGFYGTSSFSALIGKKYYRIRNEFVATDVTGMTGFAVPSTVTHNYKKTDFQTNWQAGLGLNWGKHFCRCNYYLGLKIGYEVNVWPTFISFIDVINEGNNGFGSPVDWTTWTRSILTHGLTVGARFDF